MFLISRIDASSREAFPTLTVEDITLAHDIKRLSNLDAERDCAEQARLYCENYSKKREPLKMYPYPCGQVLGHCCKKASQYQYKDIILIN